MQRRGQRRWHMSPGELATVAGILLLLAVVVIAGVQYGLGASLPTPSDLLLLWLVKGGQNRGVLLRGAALCGVSALTVVCLVVTLVRRRLGPPRFSLRTLLLAIAAIAGVSAALLQLVTLTPPGSNCGGNSAALSTVRDYLGFVQLAADERPSRRFAITSATPQERAELARIARSIWLPGARFLVSTLPYRRGDSGPRRLIIVCDTPYTNLPHRFIPSPPAHAAVFSDGSAVLLSASEYAALDRSLLVPLDELLAGQATGPPLGGSSSP